jgi:hypothetical protein
MLLPSTPRLVLKASVKSRILTTLLFPLTIAQSNFSLRNGTIGFCECYAISIHDYANNSIIFRAYILDNNVCSSDQGCTELGARSLTWSKFHTETINILCATIKEIVDTATWHPEIVHPYLRRYDRGAHSALSAWHAYGMRNLPENNIWCTRLTVWGVLKISWRRETQNQQKTTDCSWINRNNKSWK